MMVKKCFEQGCMNEVIHACKCSSPKILSCEVHICKHLILPNRAHKIESIFMQHFEGTKDAILEFLANEDLKYNELKRKFIDFFNEHPFTLKENLRDFTKKFDDYLDEINDFFAKISQAKKLSKLEPDPILRLLVLQPQEAVRKIKLMTVVNRDIIIENLESLNRFLGEEKYEAHLENRNVWNDNEMHHKTSEPAYIELANIKDLISLIRNEDSESLKRLENVKTPNKQKTDNEISLINFRWSTVTNNYRNLKEKESDLNSIDTLRNKTAEILDISNNPELEMDFRATCSIHQANSNLYDPPLMQAYQDYVSAYQQKTSLYNLTNDDNKNKLIIFNTETEKKEEKKLQTTEIINPLICITQLPNGKLFCLGSYEHSVLIDLNGGVEVLPSGIHSSTRSSCIYFNNSVYCFVDNYSIDITLSSRFDLDRKRWIKLNSMPKAVQIWSSIIFNGNILISGYNRKILLYSIYIDSFSDIPFEFGAQKRKILINAERLYLIECSIGSIYESENGSCMNWRLIADSTILYTPTQVYFSYNKGGIYIGLIQHVSKFYFHRCYKFDLNKKILTEL